MNMDFKSAKELLDLCEENQLPISEVMRQRECILGETPRDAVDHRMAKAWEIMRASATQPLKKPIKSMGGLIGGEAKKPQTVLSGEGNTFMGAVTENYVAQQLAAKSYDLYYWESSSTAELDFVLQKGNQIIGIEVKKGEHVRSRSLGVFADSYKPAYSIRLSLKNFGEKDGLKSVPLIR